MWMPILSTLGHRRSRRPSVRRNPVPTRLSIEALEDRSVPSFLAPVTSTGGGNSLTVADFNHDGRDDVAVISGLKSVSVSLSKGDGTFEAPTTLEATKGDYLLVNLYAGDINGDGFLDITAYGYSRKYQVVDNCVPTMYYGCDYTGTLYTNQWLGKGDGSFGPLTSTVTPNFIRPYLWPTSPFNPDSAIADFNHDGTSDDYATLGKNGKVAVSLRNADGTYQPPLTYAAGPNPGSIAAGDFNGDGWIDLVVVNGLSSGKHKLTVLLNDGSW